MSRGEVGKEGVAVDSSGRHGDAVRRHPARRGFDFDDDQRPSGGRLFAMYLAVAEKQGVPFDKLAGTLQADILKEYIAQKEWIYPPRESIRIITDLMAFAPATSRSGTRSRSRAITFARPVRPPCRSWPSPSPTVSVTCRPASMPVWTSMPLRRACRSSSTRTTISSRRSPSCAPPTDVGSHHARAIRCDQGSALVDAALPHADGGLLVDGPAAVQQHRARDDPGAGRHARRHAVAAHRLLRRGAGTCPATRR